MDILHDLGREKEKSIFKKIIGSKEAEFLVVYGRRRGGKTYIIQHCCSQVDYYLESTGMKNGKIPVQIGHFIKQYSDLLYGM